MATRIALSAFPTGIQPSHSPDSPHGLQTTFRHRCADHSRLSHPDRSPNLSFAFADDSSYEEPEQSHREHLFLCGQSWLQNHDTRAGWELVEYLRSPDPDTRKFAAEFLAQTQHSKVRKRDLQRVKYKLKSAGSGLSHFESANEGGNPMNAPYGLEVIESCQACEIRKSQWFCGMSDEGLQLLEEMSHPTTYPGEALLFVEGQTARGAYVLCSGKVKLSTTSREGKVLILRYAEAGDVLGLSAALTGQPFELTAETSGPCRLNFVERDALIQRIEQSGELGMRTSLALSRDVRSAQRDIHDLVLARSSAGKLAKLLISWAKVKDKQKDLGEVRIRAAATHEQMAQMIGSSRETVTRLLGDLKKKDLIRLDGPTLVIRNLSALRVLAA